MNRYDPEVFHTLQKAMKKPFDNIKPLQLTLTQFYAFMVQRYLNKIRPKIPRGSAKIQVLLDMLETTEDNNPLSIYVYVNIAYLPDGNVTWSINQYEGN